MVAVSCPPPSVVPSRETTADDIAVEFLTKTPIGIFMSTINIIIILIGLLFLTAGTYASVQSIIDGFRAGAVGGVFSCASNGL